MYVSACVMQMKVMKEVKMMKGYVTKCLHGLMYCLSVLTLPQ